MSGRGVIVRRLDAYVFGVLTIPLSCPSGLPATTAPASAARTRNWRDIGARAYASAEGATSSDELVMSDRIFSGAQRCVFCLSLHVWRSACPWPAEIFDGERYESFRHRAFLIAVAVTAMMLPARKAESRERLELQPNWVNNQALWRASSRQKGRAGARHPHWHALAATYSVARQ
jgi:hypothetical protein